MLEPIPFAGMMEIDEVNNEPVAWMSPDGKVSDTEGKLFYIPLYTHPVKELNDGGEPVKNATYWKRQHDNLLMKLNTCAVKLSELEKKLDTRTRELIGASFYEHDYKTLMAKPPLTDKEIEEVAVINLGHSMGLLNWMGFARAILKRTSEK